MSGPEVKQEGWLKYLMPEAFNHSQSSCMLYMAEFTREQLEFFGIYITEIHASRGTVDFRACELNKRYYWMSKLAEHQQLTRQKPS